MDVHHIWGSRSGWSKENTRIQGQVHTSLDTKPPGGGVGGPEVENEEIPFIYFLKH